MHTRTIPTLILIGLALLAGRAQADEGLWTFDHFPSATVKAKYGFGPEAAWLDSVRQSAVRLTSGCSASLVSADGLVLTNHHCVRDCVQTQSTAAHDYIADGFLARSRAEEAKCPGMQGEILGAISDVSGEVLAATRAADANSISKARNAAIAAIEARACKDDARSRCEVVSLYQGGQYKLYRYHKYDDVRLVFAPELAVSQFGGDPDNFNFPRYCLDSAFARLYENGAPLRTPAHLRWRRQAPQAGEVVFVAGNPGSTGRLNTIAQLEMQRDWVIPVRQLVRSELRGRLIAYGEQGAEQKRTATEDLFSIENSYKAWYGIERALLDPEFFAGKVKDEHALQRALKAHPKLAAGLGDPWADAAAAQARYREIFLRHDFLEQRAGLGSDLYRYARQLVRGAAERQKPNGERLPEFGDSRLPLLEKQLTDSRPVYAELDRLLLELWLSKSREYLTADSPEVRHLLGRDSPEALAARLVAGSKLADPKLRQALWSGGAAAISASDDPLIGFVREHDADARAVRALYDQQVDGPITRATERIARARFAIYGDQTYPDATFTLRLSYGSVAGWSYHGDSVAPLTTFAGLYQRATGAEPYALPPRWLEAKARLDLNTPFNVATSNDVIGGNSGSPLIDQDGRVMGAIFDGNIHSLGGNYWYDARLNRSVTVLSTAISAALRGVYGATALADEIETP